jgi:hypothetical protein
MKYEYHIQGNYGFGWETVTVEETKKAADETKRTYDQNERYPHRVKRMKGSQGK